VDIYQLSLDLEEPGVYQLILFLMGSGMYVVLWRRLALTHSTLAATLNTTKKVYLNSSIAAALTHSTLD
jgi:hypothetical protein